MVSLISKPKPKTVQVKPNGQSKCYVDSKKGRVQSGTIAYLGLDLVYTGWIICLI